MTEVVVKMVDNWCEWFVIGRRMFGGEIRGESRDGNFERSLCKIHKTAMKKLTIRSFERAVTC